MIKKVLTNTYLISGVIVFVLLLVLGLWTGFSLGESLFGALTIAVVAVVGYWWNEHVF